jgi:hypothetical protein
VNLLKKPSPSILLDNKFFLIYLLKNSQDTSVKRKEQENPAFRQARMGEEEVIGPKNRRLN